MNSVTSGTGLGAQAHPSQTHAAPDLVQSLRETLLRDNKIPGPVFDRACQLAAESTDDVARVLLKISAVAERDLAFALAEITGTEVMEAPLPVSDATPAARLPSKFLLENLVLPLGEGDEQLVVVMAFPHDRYLCDALVMAVTMPLKVHTGIASQVQAALEALFGTVAPLDASVAEPANVGMAAESLDRLRDLASEAPVVRFVSQLFNRAVDLRASDIHVEPQEDLSGIGVSACLLPL